MATSGSIIFPLSGVQSWKDPVANLAALPATGNTAGDARSAIDTGIIYVWSGSAWQAPSGSGTVTSVGLTLPSFLSVSGSPVTTAGTLAVTLATQVANTIFAGPNTGADASPTFRALVAADIPSLPASIITSGTLAVARGGTNLGSGTSGGILGFTAAGVIASSVLLTANALVLGGGAGATPTPMGSLGTTTTVLHGNAAGAPTFGAVSLTADVTGTLGVGNGGLGIASGTSGGILGFTASGTIASSVLLTANALLLGGGAGATPTPMASLGTTTTVLHGNAAGAPTFGAVSLTADVSSTLPVANGGTNNTTFTAYSVICAGTTATGAFQNVSGLGSSGQVLTSNGAGALPTWQAGGGGGFTESTVQVHGAAIASAASSHIGTFGSTDINTGSAITYARDATNGDTFTINTAGVYGITLVISCNSGANQFGITKNQADLTQFVTVVPAAQYVTMSTASNATSHTSLNTQQKFAVNDVIRANMPTGVTLGNNTIDMMYVTRLT